MKEFLRNLVVKKKPLLFTDVSPIAMLEKKREVSSHPFKGFDVDRVNSGFVEYLSDDDLGRLNDMLSWKCFTADSIGRRFTPHTWKS